MEKTFYDAAKEGKVEEVKDLLRKNPSLNVNWKNEEELGTKTALYVACNNDRDSVVSILLAHPDIIPNLKNADGWTPFITACRNGHLACFSLLLQDQRVMVNEPDNDGATPLKLAAAYWGYHDVIKWWIVSGREMDLGTSGDSKTDAIGTAKEKGTTKAVSLLERFQSDAAETRSEVRMELRIAGQSTSPF